jgi:hypothetical protein
MNKILTVGKLKKVLELYNDEMEILIAVYDGIEPEDDREFFPDIKQVFCKFDNKTYLCLYHNLLNPDGN